MEVRAEVIRRFCSVCADKRVALVGINSPACSGWSLRLGQLVFTGNLEPTVIDPLLGPTLRLSFRNRDRFLESGGNISIVGEDVCWLRHV